MQTLRLKQIRTDGGTQMRAGPNNQEALREYAQVLEEGGALPPVTVFFDGSDYWLADGFHRFGAHLYLNLQEIQVEVHGGTRRDAVLHAVGANASHGLRRTNADKRKAVETLLKDPEWGKWSNREIARRCTVDEGTVRNLRSSICGTSADTPRTVQRGGTTYTQQTGNIGQRAATAAPQPTAAQRLADNLARNHYEPAAPQAEPVTPPLLNPVAEPGEKVIQAEDLYVPFDDSGEPRKSAQEIEKGVKEIHSALERLLKHERDGRFLLAASDEYTRSVRSLARMAQDVLDEWLDDRSEQDAKTITIDALN